MRAYSYVWSLPVTWQRWRPQHSIHRSRKPHATCKLHGSMFYKTGVIADGSCTLRQLEFSTILLLWPWPWPVFHWDTICAKINFLRQGFWKLSSDIHTYIHTYIHTDRHDRNYIRRSGQKPTTVTWPQLHFK